jgi:hypothetical protein
MQLVHENKPLLLVHENAPKIFGVQKYTTFTYMKGSHCLYGGIQQEQRSTMDVGVQIEAVTVIVGVGRLSTTRDLDGGV